MVARNGGSGGGGAEDFDILRIIAEQKIMFAKTRVHKITSSLKQRRLPPIASSCQSLFWRRGRALLIDTLGWNFVRCVDINFNENYVNYKRFRIQFGAPFAKQSTPRNTSTSTFNTNKSVRYTGPYSPRRTEIFKRMRRK